MRIILKWVAIVLAGLIALNVVVVAAGFIIAGEKLNKVYEINPADIEIPDQATADRREWPLMLVDFCGECHGPNLSGQLMDDDPFFGTFIAPNITSGEGGIDESYTDGDWVRALRHGIAKDGKPLIIMPSHLFNKLSDKELAEIIAYVKNQEPVDKILPELKIGPLGRLIIVAGLFPDMLPAEFIDHQAARPPVPVAGATVEYGEYLAYLCQVCHTEDFSGGSGAGEGMNLTPGGQLASWTEDDFIQTLRTGVAPDGERLNGEEMPWLTFSYFNDEQLKAIWLFLQSLPAVETEYR